MSTLQLIEYFNEKIFNQNAEIERLNTRLKVLQEAGTQVGKDAWVLQLNDKSKQALWDMPHEL
jgi:hypothetical protein